VDGQAKKVKEAVAIKKKASAKRKQAATLKANRKAAGKQREKEVKKRLAQGEKPGLHKFFKFERQIQDRPNGGGIGRDQRDRDPSGGGGGGVRSSANSVRAGSSTPVGVIEC
jgi:hypothetical protein